jgi:hypothetical protein
MYTGHPSVCGFLNRNSGDIAMVLKKSLIYYSLATTDVLDEKHRNKQSILTFWAQVVLRSFPALQARYLQYLYSARISNN